MSHDESHSIARWLNGLQEGDEEAARVLWDECFDELVRLAQKRLGSLPRRDADEEDVAVSVFKSLCRGANEGRFPQMQSRDDLWRILLTITRQKVVNRIRHQTRQKRGGGHVRGESVFAVQGESSAGGIDQRIGGDATPDVLSEVDEEYHRLLQALGDEALEKVAVRRMEGYSNEEIASELGLTTRSVERKLKVIRDRWGYEVDSAN